ncbi:MAG: hypothetical protein ABSA42_22060 [Terracidiphilus sp.]|jgi:hypothetical protein
MAKAGSSSRHLRLVPDQPAVEVGEDRRAVKQARYCQLLLAVSHMTMRLFAGTVRRIEALPPPTG